MFPSPCFALAFGSQLLPSPFPPSGQVPPPGRLLVQVPGVGAAGGELEAAQASLFAQPAGCTSIRVLDPAPSSWMSVRV